MTKSRLRRKKFGRQCTTFLTKGRIEPECPTYSTYGKPGWTKPSRSLNYKAEEIFTASDLNIYYNVHDFSQCKRPMVRGGRPAETGEEAGDAVELCDLAGRQKPADRGGIALAKQEKEDLGRNCATRKARVKWEVYERWLRVPSYGTFSRTTTNFAFQIVRADYQEVRPSGAVLGRRERSSGWDCGGAYI